MRPLRPAARKTAPKYPTLRVAWRILAATMPLVPTAAYADASVPGEHQPVNPGKVVADVPQPQMPGAPPPPRPPDPPKPPKPVRLAGKK
jgi:hypothetical protein